MKVLLDTNVVLDVLQKRSPWFDDGKEIFLAVAAKQIEGFITSKEVADIYFFSRKQFKGEENTEQKARKIISGILTLLGVIDTLGEDCQNALGIENNDYEDAIMITSAKRADIDYIVTRNTAHFVQSAVPVCTPGDFVKLLSPSVDAISGILKTESSTGTDRHSIREERLSR